MITKMLNLFFNTSTCVKVNLCEVNLCKAAKDENKNHALEEVNKCVK